MSMILVSIVISATVLAVAVSLLRFFGPIGPYGGGGFHLWRQGRGAPGSDAVTIILSMLRDRPDEWKQEPIFWRHPTGAAISLDHYSRRASLYLNGLVTASASEERAMFKAIRRAETQRTRQRETSETAAFAKRVIDHYERENADTVVPFRTSRG